MILISSTAGWSTRNVFESPGDEAFYGLGQYQADDWNYKDGNEELFQYNTMVFVPFIVSSRNYGYEAGHYATIKFPCDESEKTLTISPYWLSYYRK